MIEKPSMYFTYSIVVNSPEVSYSIHTWAQLDITWSWRGKIFLMSSPTYWDICILT